MSGQRERSGSRMSTASVLTPLPVLIPMLGAALTLFAGRRPRLQRAITLAALCAVVAVCAALLYLTDRDGTLALHVGGWGPSGVGHGPAGHHAGGGPAFGADAGGVVDRAAGRGVLRHRAGHPDGDERQPVSIFLPTYLVLSAGVCNAFLAGDLFNLFVGFEMLLSASFVLLTIGASKERVRAGIAYVMVSMVSSLIFLFGIALVYAATGTLNMAELAVRLDGVTAGTRSALFAVLLVAFGIKAAVFPLSTWLPDSYPTAPAPVTAVFAGLLTKVGVYAIIRAHTLLFPSGGLDPAADGGGAADHGGRHPRRDRAERHQAAAVVHAGQPHRLHGVRHRAVEPARHVGCDLLRGAPHRGADDAVPGGRPDRAAGGRIDAAAARRAGRGQPAAGVRVRGARAQSRWHSAVFRVHRQGRAAGGGRAERFGAGVAAGRRRRAHQPADAVRGGPGVDQGVLAIARGRPGGPPIAAAAPSALLDEPEDIQFVDRDHVGTDAGRDAGADGRAHRGRADADGAGGPDLRLQRAAPPTRCSTAASTSRPCWEATHEARGAAGMGAVLADAGVDSVVGHGFCGQHHLRPGHRVGHHGAAAAAGGAGRGQGAPDLACCG